MTGEKAMAELAEVLRLHHDDRRAGGAPMTTTPDTRVPTREAGYWRATDELLSWINALDTEDMTPAQVRSAFYAKLMAMRPSLSTATPPVDGEAKMREALIGAIACMHNEKRRAAFHAGINGQPNPDVLSDAYADGVAAREALASTQVAGGGE